MSEDILQTLIHVAAVTIGLYVLWSVMGAMRGLDRLPRFYSALAAGLITGVVVLVVRLAT